jgi:hypothetical protein
LTEDTNEGAWSLEDRDRQLLGDLRDSIRKLASLTRSGLDLVALGEAWDAVERILEGESVNVNVRISVGFRRGDTDFKEGLIAGVRINWDEIVFDELTTTYSSDVGSDHSTRTHAVFLPSGRFDRVGFRQWVDLLDEVRRADDARISTERDHI